MQQFCLYGCIDSIKMLEKWRKSEAFIQNLITKRALDSIIGKSNYFYGWPGRGQTQRE